jgi:hypothetical protein
MTQKASLRSGLPAVVLALIPIANSGLGAPVGKKGAPFAHRRALK